VSTSQLRPGVSGFQSQSSLSPCITLPRRLCQTADPPSDGARPSPPRRGDRPARRSAWTDPPTISGMMSRHAVAIAVGDWGEQREAGQSARPFQIQVCHVDRGFYVRRNSLNVISTPPRGKAAQRLACHGAADALDSDIDTLTGRYPSNAVGETFRSKINHVLRSQARVPWLPSPRCRPSISFLPAPCARPS